jgi:hypothetical protein
MDWTVRDCVMLGAIRRQFCVAKSFRSSLVVVYAHETESMRGGGLTCSRAISSPQDIRETVWSPFAQPHFDHRSNYRADHVLEKPVGISLNENLVVMADDGESL